MWSNLTVRGISEALQKVKKNEFKKAHLKGKAYISFDFFFKQSTLSIDGRSYRSNTIVNTEYLRTQYSFSPLFIGIVSLITCFTSVLFAMLYTFPKYMIVYLN